MKKKIFLRKLKTLFFVLILDRVIRILLFPISFAIFMLIVFLSPFKVIRLGKFRSDKIGHLSLEYEIILNEKLKKKNKSNTIDLWFKSKKICNLFYYNLRKKDFFILPNFIFNEVFILLKKTIIFNKHCFHGQSDSDTNYVLDKTKSSITLSQSFIIKHLRILYDLGLRKKQKIVCLHLRDTAYRGYSKYTDYKNIHRPENYLKTIRYLIKKGYFVIRTGKRTKKILKIKNKYFLDYSRSNIRSDQMDIFLAHQCFFCISSGSGFDGVVRSFRKPVLFTNFLPIGYLHSFSKNNMTIFKHLIYKKKRKISLKENLDLDLAFESNGEIFKEKNLKFVENTEQEVYNAVKDMINYLDGRSINFAFIKKKIEKIFKLEFIKKYGFTPHKKINGIIAPSFINSNKNLF
ncbi:TIGR04372 family glycosyltransferase [Candidatus Pelagibacter ubique]|nr:TIGR04372 family glycosyltransferase [Candidatus Pelagibacter ubique]